ncbi:hypothetical protein E5Q62_28265, partial [Klebsiella oxytoca]|uniref:hypothetical protein n=1 Tax=Klebsiella oxytoca TaxID=571 RepID=UPI0011017192
FTPSTRGVVPNAISPGSRYRIEIRTRFSSLVSVLATSKMQYDNVRLTVFDGSGGGGGGGGQGGTGAGGLGACTADLSRPAIATGRA